MALEGTHGTGNAARLIAFCSWIWNCSKKRHANESRDLEGHRHGMYFSENVVHFAQKEANETERMKLLNGDAMEEIEGKGVYIFSPRTIRSGRRTCRKHSGKSIEEDRNCF